MKGNSLFKQKMSFIQRPTSSGTMAMSMPTGGKTTEEVRRRLLEASERWKVNFDKTTNFRDSNQVLMEALALLVEANSYTMKALNELAARERPWKYQIS